MSRKIVKPDYANSILSVIGSINKNFGYNYTLTNNKLDEIIEKHQYDHVILMLLDGLGTKVLNNNLGKKCFLQKQKIADLIAIYPSTTACATISTISGKEPIETGWIGWENYFCEIDKNVVLFNNTDYFTGEKLDFNCFDNLPYSKFFDNYNFYHDEIYPPFGKNPCDNFDELLDKTVQLNNQSDKTFLYVYWTEPNYSIHEYTSKHSKIKKMLVEMNDKIEEFTKKLTKNTLLIIVADHGHTNVKPIYLKKDKVLLSYLERMPANEGRCCTFKVENDKRKEFVYHFNKKYGHDFKLYSKTDFIENGMIGDKNKVKNPRLDDFLADYIACGISNKYFDYATENVCDNQLVFKSHHAGLTENEMLIPLIVYKKGEE